MRMFTDRESAEQAYKTLHERGYSKEDINLVMTNGNIVMGVHPHENDSITPKEKEWMEETSEVSGH
jgi:hypothetical protein